MRKLKLFENRCLKSYLQERMSEIIFLSQKIDGMGGDTWHRDD